MGKTGWFSVCASCKNIPHTYLITNVSISQTFPQGTQNQPHTHTGYNPITLTALYLVLTITDWGVFQSIIQTFSRPSGGGTVVTIM